MSDTVTELPQRVLVLGVARSGKAAVAALERRGVEVVTADRTLANDGDLGLLDGVGLMVKSPGVPRDTPIVAEAGRRGVAAGEGELVGLLPCPAGRVDRLLRARFIGFVKHRFDSLRSRGL